MKPTDELSETSVLKGWSRMFAEADAVRVPLSQAVEDPDNKLRIALLSFGVAVVIFLVIGTVLYQWWKRK